MRPEKTIRATTPEAYSEIIELLRDEPETGSRVGGAREELNVQVVSDNPRERWLVRDDGFNLAFALQESFAYWRGLNPGHVQRYNSNMERWVDDETGELPGSAYGDRMRNTAGHDQIKRAISQLEESPDTRRAMIAVHQPAVEDYDGGDVACTAYLHPLLRDGELHMIADVRSQDMYWGYPYDAQNNQFLQEAMAGALGADLGRYVHRMNSAHYYTDMEDDVVASLDEAEARSTSDMRLSGDDLGSAMSLLDTGLERARNGHVPVDNLDALSRLHDGYGDWLGLMTAYEQARFHDDPGTAVTAAEGIGVDWWREWALGAVDRHA